MKRLFAPLGRRGFIIASAALALLYGVCYLLFVYTALAHQVNPPAYIPAVYIMYALIWYIPAVIVQMKRLKDIGVNFWLGLALSLAAPLSVFFWFFWKQAPWQGLIPVGLWVLALAYKKPPEQETPKEDDAADPPA